MASVNASHLAARFYYEEAVAAVEVYGDGTFGVEEDSVVAPIGDPDWTLTCLVDGHYTDGPHTFRVVFHCQDESKDYSFPVFVDSERGVPVLITGPKKANGFCCGVGG